MVGVENLKRAWPRKRERDRP